MAIWQFAFELVPVAAMVRLHGAVPAVLDQYAAHVPDAHFDPDEEFPNYWHGFDKACLNQAVEKLLPRCVSWSDEATMYGDLQGSDIQVWGDSVAVRLDCRDFNAALFEGVLELARQFDCMLALKDGGTIIAPHRQAVLAAIMQSPAVRFLSDPAAYLARVD